MTAIAAVMTPASQHPPTIRVGGRCVDREQDEEADELTVPALTQDGL